jgi:ribosomal protein S18 acetylase RimI-like enzyme
MTEIRPGTEADAMAAATLHASEISEGFLPSLGRPFLARLYRRIVRSRGSFLLVAHDGDEIVGFVAGTEHVRDLYRSFLWHDGAGATVAALPRIVRSWRRVVETLRYPVGASPERAGQARDLPPAELLAIAVIPAARGRGAGRQLVEALTSEFRRRGVGAVRVVVGAENDAALALYEHCGFVTAAVIEVHRGTPSRVLTWP